MSLIGVDELILKIYADDKALEASFKKLGNMFKHLESKMTPLPIMFREIGDMFPGIDKVNKSLKVATKSAYEFDGAMLSLMFGFMQLGRLGSSGFRAIFNTFNKVEDNTSALSNATLGLSASWEFLKFSIFNALDQPWFINFLEWIISAINWVSDFINKWPAVGIAIVAAFGVLAVGGAIGTFLAGFMLFWDAVIAKIGGSFIAMTGAGSGGASATTLVGSFARAMSTLRVLAGAGLLIKAAVGLYDSITSDTPMTGSDVMFNILSAAAGGFLVAGGPGAAIATLIVAVALTMSETSKNFSKELEKMQETPLERRGAFGAMNAFEGTSVPVTSAPEGYGIMENPWKWLTGEKKDMVTTYVDDIGTLGYNFQRLNLDLAPAGNNMYHFGSTMTDIQTPLIDSNRLIGESNTQFGTLGQSTLPQATNALNLHNTELERYNANMANAIQMQQSSGFGSTMGTSMNRGRTSVNGMG